MATVLISCGGGNSTTSPTYTIGGTVSGLTSGSVVLLNNGGDALTISANSSAFTFTTTLPNSASYAVTVGTQPTSLICTVTNGSGTVSGTNVTNVAVSCVPPWVGTKQLGVSGKTTSGSSVATDVSGNVYVAGYTQGGLDGNTLTGTTADLFVTKYNSSGVKQFTKQLGVAGAYTYGVSVATDASSNVYVAGYTQGGLDGNTLTGTTDLSLTKYNSSGVKQFTKQLGVTGKSTTAYSVATDASGNVYITGSTTGGLDGNTLTGTTDLFVTKYNSSGEKQFTKQLGVAGKYAIPVSLVTDASGNVYITGSTNGGFDGNTLMGTIDLFMTKYNSSGVKQFTKQLGVAGKSTAGYSVATDKSGNAYVVGYTTGGLDGNTLAGTYDYFLIKYDSSGVKQYTKQMGVTGNVTAGLSVATDASANVYVVGKTQGGLDGNTLTGIDDLFLAKYDTSGVKQYTKQLGVAGKSAIPLSVAIDASANAFLSGYTNGGLDGNTLTGTYDLFVTKYNSSGVKQ